ncbi:hypothetical protein JW968_05870 [Candidatus Woesearchaeota archaeon]|nr:hypothetical protein [Candidatus Woesearchaeota archaeon]
MVTKKDRRHSGYTTPRATISKNEILHENIFIDIFYDEWQNYRDCYRDWYSDFKKIKNVNRSVRFYSDSMYKKRMLMNKKQKILSGRRRQKKFRYKR